MWSGRTRAIKRPPIAEINSIALRLEAEGRDLINLGQAVLGLPPPERAMERVRAYMEGPGPHGYSPDPGMAEVREAVADFLLDVKGVAAAAAERVMLTCGANQAFVNALLSVTEPGDEVVFFGPYYFDHVFAIQLAGCVPVEVPLAMGGSGYGIDLEGLKTALSDKTRVVTLVSPGNPTGMVADQEAVEALCGLCRERGVWLFSDETYDLLTFPPAVHACPASVSPGERVVSMGSFSKTFALAGWRVGYLYGNEGFIEETIKVQDTLVVCAPVPSQLAALGALEARDSFVPEAVSELEKRRDLGPDLELAVRPPGGGDRDGRPGDFGDTAIHRRGARPGCFSRRLAMGDKRAFGPDVEHHLQRKRPRKKRRYLVPNSRSPASPRPGRM